MHCLKTIHDTCGELDIRLYPSNESQFINRIDWKILQDSSLICNPFYEDWNLLPAIENLTKQNEQVWIATIYCNHSLIGLFPVSISKLYGLIPICSLWQHNHAFLSEPLQSTPFDLARVLNEISNVLGGIVSFIPLHQGKYFSSYATVSCHRYQRAAILNSKNIDPHLSELNGKRVRELNRVKRRLEENFKLDFFRFSDIQKGLKAFGELENKGWKAEKKGAIYAHKNVKNYYHSLIKYNDHNKLEVLGFTANGRLIACAIRLKSNDHYFEIKTTYDESFKSYAPGKVMEWYLLQDLKTHDMIHVDSCTHESNGLINWLWPDRIDVYRSYVFSQQPIGKIMARLHNIKKWIGKQFSHA